MLGNVSPLQNCSPTVRSLPKDVANRSIAVTRRPHDIHENTSQTETEIEKEYLCAKKCTGTFDAVQSSMR